MFEDQTQEAIIARMIGKVDPQLDTREGSIVFDMLSPASIELAQAYMQLDSVLNFGFADTTYGEYLDMRAAEVGLTRKGATYSSGSLSFSGPANITIPAGTLVSNGDMCIVKTSYDVILVNGTATADAIATSTGVSCNVAPSQLTTMVNTIVGVTVTNPLPFDGGMDEEDDEALLTRYKIRTQDLVAPGNDTYYRLQATSIPGVFDARVYPMWEGVGTVKVVILSPNKKSPSDAVIKSVSDIINNNAMLGADVTVVGVEEVTVDIDVTLTLQPNALIPQNEIATSLTSYFESIAFNDLTVRSSKIGNTILDATGVIDFENLLLNGKTSNITVEDYQVAVLGRLTITTN
jgi:uncharacterized phage protein gp47/JayE